MKCQKCQTTITGKDKKCPHCGAAQSLGKVEKLVIAALACGLLIFMANWAWEDTKEKAARANTPPPPVSHEETEFQFAVLATKLVRESVKNPESFELVTAGVVDGGALCLTYRATNSFGAKVTERTAVTRALKTGTWNKDCGNRTVTMLPNIKYAL